MSPSRALLSFLVALCAVSARVAYGGAADYIYSPIVQAGERELELKFGRAKDGQDVEGAGGIGYAQAISDRWMIEAIALWKKAPHERTKFDAVELESVFQLTQTGEYPIDVGVFTELELPKQRDDPREFVIGPLLQAETGRVQYNLNVFFERKFGGQLPPGDDYDTVLRYQAQVKYRWQETLEFGVQALGETGKWNDWAPREAQDHRIGPAIFGKLHLGERRVFIYNAAWLYGASNASPHNVLRVKMEWEF